VQARPRVLVVGLDCVPPALAFARYRADMPNLSRLMARGSYGPLRSTIPPITVPAWASLFSGYDPGELGLYGFRNRELGSYQLRVASSRDLALPMVWDRLRDDQRACVLFVPPSYPPRAVRGELVSCFLTPDASAAHTHPPELAHELAARFGPYRPDVDEYRTDDLPALLDQLYADGEQRFSIAEYLLRTRQPDFTAMVEIGPDRLHHAFWSHIDPSDPRHVPGNPYAETGRAYYQFLDRQLGRLLDAAGPGVDVLVLSDHGARPLRGAICINEWLIEHGYLVLHAYPQTVTPFAQLQVDWSRTRAFAEGGYYARVVLNITGREPQGSVPAHEAEALAAALGGELAQLPGPHGEPLAHRVLTPRAAHREQRGLPPDLLVFFDDLGFRALGSVGHRSSYSTHNDTGPDACNHDWDGIFVLAGPNVMPRGALSGLRADDVAVTLLGLLKLPAADLPGIDQRGRA
jgi:predicted AlkP superfamily phosphohydrolase/phosphomutase